MNDVATMMDEVLCELAGDPATTQSAARQSRCRRLVLDNVEFIARTLRRFGVAESDVEDATQRVFLVAAARLDQIAVDRERSFLFGTARRVSMAVRRHARSRREEPEEAGLSIADPRPGPEEALDERRARLMLDEALDAMPLDFRVVFVMYELEQLTMAEIATLIEVAPGTVASRLRRAREIFHAAAARIRARHESAATARRLA